MNEIGKLYWRDGKLEILLIIDRGLVRHHIYFPDVDKDIVMDGVVAVVQRFAEKCLEVCDGHLEGG